jgi:hypothetical protein
MSQKLSHFLILLAVALAVAIVPIACSSDNGGGDSGSDAVTGMTHG